MTTAHQGAERTIWQTCECGCSCAVLRLSNRNDDDYAVVGFSLPELDRFIASAQFVRSTLAARAEGQPEGVGHA